MDYSRVAPYTLYFDDLSMTWNQSSGSSAVTKRAKPVRKRLTKVVIDAAQPHPEPGRDRMIWDTEIKGFGLQVKPSGHRAYVYQYRNPVGRLRRLTLGTHGALTAAQARKEAIRIAGEVSTGVDPTEGRTEARTAPTVRDLAERFMKDHVGVSLEKKVGETPRKSLSTARNCRLIWTRHILPTFGARRVSEITWADVASLHSKMRSTPYSANRMLSLVSKAWSLAAKWGWWPREIPNPGRDHDRYPEDHDRGSSLDQEQLRALGVALAKEEGVPGEALRCCLLCGARPDEVLNLRWSDLEPDRRVALLPESKTGPRRVFFGKAAAEVIDRQREVGEYVFPGGDPRRKASGSQDPNKPLYDLKRVWSRVRDRAGLRLRLYDATRHTFATWAEELGVAEVRRKRIVGHSVRDITARYTHHRREVLLADADLVSSALAEMLEGRRSEALTALHTRD